MVLSGRAIAAACVDGQVRIHPYSEDRLRAASYVLHLATRFRQWRATSVPINLWRVIDEEELVPVVRARSFILGPGEFVLAQTAEVLTLPLHLAGQLSPLSHVARFGLSIHCGADWVSPGFGAEVPTALTLEIVNHNASPVVIEAAMPICHLRFIPVTRPLKEATRSVYEGRDPLLAPQLFEEMHLRSRPHELSP